VGAPVRWAGFEVAAGCRAWALVWAWVVLVRRKSKDKYGTFQRGFDADRLVVTFLERARGRGLARVLDAYEHYLQGFPRGTPVRYPANPDSDADRYAWFMQNRDGAKRSLGRLEAGYHDLKPPTNPVAPPQPAGERRQWGSGQWGRR